MNHKTQLLLRKTLAATITCSLLASGALFADAAHADTLTSAAESRSTSSGTVTAWVKTSWGNLNMRSSASTSASIISKIPNNAQITVYGSQTNGFYKVSYNGTTGYASASYITFSQTSGLVETNLQYVSAIKQGSKTCKASAVAQCLNLIAGYNKFSTSDLGDSSCKNIDGYVYTGSDGNKYKAAYKTDSYIGSASEQLSVINAAVSAGLPVAAAVHSTKTGGTQHHWVTIIGKSGSTYRIIDPASGSVTTMSAAGYSFGLTDYSQTHYGYVSFTRQ